MKLRSFWMAALTALLVVSAAAPASADTLKGWGPRVGLSADPDQLWFGAHFDLGPIARRVRLQPNLEFGVGDDRTVLATFFEAAYRLRESWDVWTPYVGGGLGVVTVGSDDGLFDGPTHSDLGVTGLFGIEKMQGDHRFFMETKLGLVDAPDFKLGLGWTFF